jgi:WD domain, G-beta repeat
VPSPPHLSRATCVSLTQHHPQVWDIATKSILSRFEGHENTVVSLDFSRDGRLIISGSLDNTVRIWDMETKQHKTLSITVGVDVRVVVTYYRVWHANACCVYGRRCWLHMLYFVFVGLCINVGRRHGVLCHCLPRWVPSRRVLL